MRRNRVAQDPAKALDGIEGTRPASKAGSEKDATNRIKVMVSALSLTRPVKHRDSEVHRAALNFQRAALNFHTAALNLHTAALNLHIPQNTMVWHM